MSGKPDANGVITRRHVQTKQRFLEAYGRHGVIMHAAKEAKCERKQHYRWLENDPVYARKFYEAVQVADDVLLHEIRFRALDRDRRDTVALIVALKMRGLFVERREISGPDGGPQEHKVMTPEDTKIAERIATRRFAAN